MMEIERTHDYELVRKIMVHPRIWPHISDDGSGDPADFRPPGTDRVVYLAVGDMGSVYGLWMLHPWNHVCWEVHTMVLPEGRGRPAYQGAIMTLEWAFRHVARKVVTQVPAPNIQALRFAQRCGMQVEGINRASFLRRGVLHDQTLLGITQEAFACQQQQSEH
jgi:RimJ/RimL family protein N-acetyltransferase